MPTPLTTRAHEVVARCRRLAQCTEVPGQITRLSFSQPMHAVYRLLRVWMEAAGMTTAIDTAGNLRGLYPAAQLEAQPEAPRLIIASHLDTVPNAGAFDGVLGVVLGLVVIEELHGERLPYAIEIIGFSDEEGVRFGKPFLGTRSLFGPLDAETLARADAHGITVAEAMRAFAAAESDPTDPTLSPKAFAYLEFHIEQGPVLEAESQPLGVVEAIAGQTRLQLTFTGEANHAGTTPMRLRHDALAAAAAWVVEGERTAADTPGLVATVGRLEARPGAVNVVPGEVTATLDVRHAYDDVRQAAVAALLTHAGNAAAARGVTLATANLHDQPAVPMAAHLVTLLQQAAARAGFSAQRMTSGAGHDAMVVAPRLPSVMLFLRSPGGLSHHPNETVLTQDVEAALATASHFLGALAKTA
jgi:allantoate deiminase